MVRSCIKILILLSVLVVSSCGKSKLNIRLFDFDKGDVPQTQLTSFISGNFVENFTPLLTGNARDVVTKGSYAYMSSSSGGLFIYDISNPSSPVFIKNIYKRKNENFSAYHMQIYNNLLFVALYGVGIAVYDLSNPSDPEQITLISTAAPTTVECFKIVNDILYLYRFTDFYAIDIADIQNPVLLDSMTTLSSNQGALALYGNYALLAVGSAGIEIVDISDPANLTSVTSYDTPGYAQDIEIKNNVAYIADNSNGVEVIDLSNPLVPASLGNLSWPSDFVNAIELNGDFLYIDDGPELRILNTVTLDQWGGYTIDGADTYDNMAFIGGGTALIASGGKGLISVDLTDKASPLLQSSSTWLSSIRATLFHNNYLYLLDQYNGLAVLNYSDPLDPQLVYTYKFEGTATPNGLKIKDNKLYASYDSTVIVFDISNVQSIGLLTSHNYGTAISSFTLTDTHMFISMGLNTSEFVALSDISTIVGSYNSPGTAYEICVSNNVAYVADRTSIQVLDISDISSPLLIGSDTSLYRPTACQVEGNLLFVTDYYFGVDIFDISTPSNPIHLSHHDSLNTVYGMLYKDNYIYLAVDWNGIRIVDVSNPNSPFLVDQYESYDMDHRALSMTEDYLFASQPSGYIVFDMSDKNNVFSSDD